MVTENMKGDLRVKGMSENYYMRILDEFNSRFKS